MVVEDRGERGRRGEAGHDSWVGGWRVEEMVVGEGRGGEGKGERGRLDQGDSANSTRGGPIAPKFGFKMLLVWQSSR